MTSERKDLLNAKRYDLVEVLWTGRAADYDGSQLRSHYIREQTGIANDAVIAFAGACNVRGARLVDLEDAEAGSTIVAAHMLHFIGEHFQAPLREANFRLRLFVSILKERIEATAPGVKLSRDGDDLFAGKRKLTVAIATSGPLSSLFHCGVNIDPAGAPVPAVGLEELGIDHAALAEAVLEGYREECLSIELAMRKVRGV